ncbi:MAG: DMT family transporter [Rickettsiaceae bacterium]|nr:DMT family transporter [Rickettsiaceae bacterium]
MSLTNKNSMLAVLWFICSLFISVTNDVITKYTGFQLGIQQVIFCRFFFSFLVILPVILMRGVGSIKTNNLFLQIARGVLLFFGMSSWMYSITIVPIATATIVNFSIPIFVLILARIFLKEKVTLLRWIVTLIGFVGIVTTLKLHDCCSFDSIALVLGAIIFASLDVINKSVVSKESMLAMLFYSALISTLLAMPQAIISWQPLTIEHALLFLTLGIGANMILFCLLKAFSYTDASALAPYRYLELPISLLVGYILFNDSPDKYSILGAAMIIPSTFFIIYSEAQKKYQA